MLFRILVTSLTGRPAHNPPACSIEWRTAVPVLLVVFCVVATSAPAAGMSSRKVGIKGLPPFSEGVWFELEIGTSL